MEPLAQRLRPRSLAEVCGQQHLLAPGMVFRRTMEAARQTGRIPNMIFYGPSGVGKTTVAGIIAENSGMRLHKLNGTTASTADIKAVLSEIGTLSASGGILLYLDEIQYFNKRQQQSLLECIEQGTVTLIASTTENPYFYIYNALLSRCTVFEFKPLSADDIAKGLQNAARRLGEEDGVPVALADGLVHPPVLGIGNAPAAGKLFKKEQAGRLAVVVHRAKVPGHKEIFGPPDRAVEGVHQAGLPPAGGQAGGHLGKEGLGGFGQDPDLPGHRPGKDAVRAMGRSLPAQPLQQVGKGVFQFFKGL